MSSDFTPTLVIRLMEQPYGIPVSAVREILRMPEVTGLPRRSAFIRGLINLRGAVMPVLDLRLLLGYPSLRDELQGLRNSLDQREEEHRQWLAELEASVNEGRGFKLTLDPHACAFGRWYDRFMQTPMAFALRAVLGRFNQPHQDLHALGSRVVAAVGENDLAGARQMIEAHRTTHFTALLQLFAEARAVVESWGDEVVVVLDSPTGPLATAADGVEGIERIQFRKVRQAARDDEASALVEGIGSPPNSDRLITLLRLEGIFREGTVS